MAAGPSCGVTCLLMKGGSGMSRALWSHAFRSSVLILEELEPRIAPSVVGVVDAPNKEVAALEGSVETTLGPWTPEEIAAFSQFTTPPQPGAQFVDYIPTDFDWWYGCSPTTGGMHFAFWENDYDPDVFPGDSTDWVWGVYPSSNASDFQHANGVVAGYEHAMVDSWWGHAPNSMADFLLTEFGGTFPTDVEHGYETFAGWDDPTTPENESFEFAATFAWTPAWGGTFTYDVLKAEIDANRPVHLGLYGPWSGHSVLAVGYNDSGAQQCVELLTTWGPTWGVQEWEWANEDDSGQVYSVAAGITLQPVPVTVPSLAGYVSIAHTWIGDLYVDVGLGDPANPLWEQAVWSGQGGGDANLVVTDIDLTGAMPYLDQSQTWYVRVYDSFAGDTGTIEDFQVWFGGPDGARWFTPDVGTPVQDLQTSYAYVQSQLGVPLVALDPSSDTGISNTDGITSDTMPLFTVEVVKAGTTRIDFDNDGTWDEVFTAGSAGVYPVQSTVNFKDGVHTVVASFDDPALGTMYGRMQFTVDTMGPLSPFAPDLLSSSDTGLSQTDNLTSDTTPSISLAGYATRFRLFRDGLQISGDYATAGVFTETTPLAEGAHTYVAYCVDAAGNLSRPSGFLDVVVDSTAPTVLAVDPADGSYVSGLIDEIAVHMNDSMNPGALRGAAVMLESSGGDGTFGDGNEVLMPLTLTYDAASNTALLGLPRPLASETYRLSMSPRFDDAAGNWLDGDGDGVGGDAYTAQFTVAASHTWQEGPVTVTAYDMDGGMDFDPDDIRVRFGPQDSVSLIKLGGSDSMEGLGLVVQGATSVNRIVDARQGPLGGLSFIASDSPVSRLILKGPVTGYDLNGMTVGGIALDADIDGDGQTDDPLSIGVQGGLLKARLGGAVGGDVLVDGPVRSIIMTGGLAGDLLIGGDARVVRIGGAVGGEVEVDGGLKTLLVAGALSDDLYIGGDLGRAAFGGPLGAEGCLFEVVGAVASLSVGSRTSPADVLSDILIAGGLRQASFGDVHGMLDVGGSVARLSAGYICDSITIAGDLGNLKTMSALSAPVGLEDWVFDNPGAMDDGDLTVTGSIGRIRAA